MCLWATPVEVKLPCVKDPRIWGTVVDNISWNSPSCFFGVPVRLKNLWYRLGMVFRVKVSCFGLFDFWGKVELLATSSAEKRRIECSRFNMPLRYLQGIHNAASVRVCFYSWVLFCLCGYQSTHMHSNCARTFGAITLRITLKCARNSFRLKHHWVLSAESTHWQYEPVDSSLC